MRKVRLCMPMCIVMIGACMCVIFLLVCSWIYAKRSLSGDDLCCVLYYLI